MHWQEMSNVFYDSGTNQTTEIGRKKKCGKFKYPIHEVSALAW